MAVYKDTNKTVDGRAWFYLTYKKDFSGNNKKYKSKRYMTKSEAQEAERLFLMKRDNPINKSFVLVASDYFNSLKESVKESTYVSYIQLYELHIQPYFNKYNINDINIPIIRKWAENVLKMGFSASYLNNMYIILKNIFDFGIKNYGLTSNPMQIYGRFKIKKEDVLDPNKNIRYITYEDFNKFISVIDDITWKTFFIFLYYTGMRKGEVQALTWKDIDFNTNQITVNKTLTVKSSEIYKITSTKTNVSRRIKMSKTLREQLILYKKEMMKYTDYSENWFVFGCARFLPQTTIYRYKDYYFKLAKVKPITIHEFRHSHVSLLINEYVKSGQTDTAKFFLMMSDRMGHSIEVMQNVYMHLFPTIQNEIVDILDNL